MLLLMLLCSALLVAGGIWTYAAEPVVAIMGIGFFGLCGLVAIVCMIPGASYLTLTAEGFWFASLFRKNFVAWKDVDHFIVADIRANKMVGWNYTADFGHQSALRRVNSAIAGIEGGLPDTYGHSAAELAELMNELRAKFGDSSRESLPGTTRS